MFMAVTWSSPAVTAQFTVITGLKVTKHTSCDQKYKKK